MKLVEVIDQPEDPFMDDTSDAFTDEGIDLKQRAIIYRLNKIIPSTFVKGSISMFDLYEIIQYLSKEPFIHYFMDHGWTPLDLQQIKRKVNDKKLYGYDLVRCILAWIQELPLKELQQFNYDWFS